MTLPASGPLSLADIAAEFGGATPHGLQEYYDAASGIPVSGPISIQDFYGAASVPDINFPGAWTLGGAGSIWTLSEEVTDASGFLANPSFETTFLRIRHGIYNVGYFDPVYQDASCAIPAFGDTGSYRLHYTLVATTNSPRGVSRLNVEISGAALSSTVSENIDAPTASARTLDFSVTSTSAATLRFRSQFANTVGTQGGDGGRADINNVYLERL